MLANSARILVRRWRLVTLAFFLGGLAGGGASVAVLPTQHVEASVLFVPSLRQPGVEGPTNPLLSLTGSVAVVASVVQIAVTDEQTQLKLAEAGHTAKYEVQPDLSENAGPILTVSAEDQDPRRAQETRDAVVQEIVSRLTQLQSDRKVPEDLWVTTVLLTSDPRPEVIHKKQIQFAVGAAGATTALGLLLVLLGERRQASRRDRRDAGHPESVRARSPLPGERKFDKADDALGDNSEQDPSAAPSEIMAPGLTASGTTPR